MFQFTLLNKPLTIPATASELTLGQFIALQKATDELEFLTILMGETPETKVSSEKDIVRLGNELDNVYKLISLLREDMELCITSGVLLCEPKTVTVMWLDVDVQKEFKFKPTKTTMNEGVYFGYVHAREAIKQRAQLGKDENFNITDLIPNILAHNLYSLVTKSPYNERKADEFVEVINEMNFIEAIQLGNFFLFQQKKLWTSRGKRWRIFLNRLKSMLVSKYLINTVPQMYSKRYREVTYLNGKV